MFLNKSPSLGFASFYSVVSSGLLGGS